MYKTRIIYILISLIVFGCAPAQFLPLGDDIYTISQTSAGGMFKSMSSLREEVITRANAFAENNGKVAEAVSEKESPAWPGHMPSFTYTFRLVSTLPLEAKAGDYNSKQTNSGETYKRLLELEDLRTKGIISGSEFDALKSKIVSQVLDSKQPITKDKR